MNRDAILLATICNGSADGILVSDINQNIVLWNKTLESITGVSATVAIGSQLSSESNLLQHVLEHEMTERVYSGVPTHSLNRPYRSPTNGEVNHYEVHYSPWRNADNDILGSVITIRRQPRREQREKLPAGLPDERFKIMADCAPVMLWMAGRDARCLFFNEPWLSFTGRTMEEEYGYGWVEGVHHEDFQACVDTYMSAFNARREFTMEYRLRRHDGAYQWILDNGKPYWDSEGNFKGFIGSCTDITTLRLAKQLEIDKARLETKVVERERAAKELQSANAELEAFAYSVSHDLRGPLRGIFGYSQALAEDFSVELAPEAHRYLEQIRSSAEEMGWLIDDLLEFSRLSNLPVNKKLLQPKDIVDIVLSEVKQRRNDQEVEVVVAGLPDCQADPHLLKQVFVNLIDNAFKYSSHRNPAHIEIGSKNIDQKTVYYVKDDGAGFDMSQAPKLFKVFQRLHDAEEFNGTGLGLAIVQRIISRHGGRIWAESAVGKGATFFFYLPEFAGKPEKQQTSARMAHAAP